MDTVNIRLERYQQLVRERDDAFDAFLSTMPGLLIFTYILVFAGGAFILIMLLPKYVTINYWYIVLILVVFGLSTLFYGRYRYRIGQKKIRSYEAKKNKVQEYKKLVRGIIEKHLDDTPMDEEVKEAIKILDFVYSN